MTTTYYLSFLLLIGIAFIIWATVYKKLHAFFSLTIAAIGIGILAGIPLVDIVNLLKAGFGHTMEKIGLLIILGTTLGVILERSGATLSMANAVLRVVKEKNAPLAIAITGFIIGIPIFCDSGFIILSGLNHSIVRKTHFRMPVMATVLATSLYSVHCLVPPHPGITAAVGTMNADVGMVMICGILLALPAAITGYLWSIRRGRNVKHIYVEDKRNENSIAQLPSAARSFFPVLIPIILIAAKSLVQLIDRSPEMQKAKFMPLIAFFGDPVIALSCGLIVSILLLKKKSMSNWSEWLNEAVGKAGMILAIIAAGGMFGEVLQATGIGNALGSLLAGLSLGIFFPFVITAILKTAQGSSTVAVITASSLVLPLLPRLGVHSSMGLTMVVLSMGAGSMVISHANDAYFWVINRFSNLETSMTLKMYTVATLLMGMVTQLLIWIVFYFWG